MITYTKALGILVRPLYWPRTRFEPANAGNTRPGPAGRVSLSTAPCPRGVHGKMSFDPATWLYDVISSAVFGVKKTIRDDEKEWERRTEAELEAEVHALDVRSASWSA